MPANDIKWAVFPANQNRFFGLPGLLPVFKVFSVQDTWMGTIITLQQTLPTHHNLRHISWLLF
jgi:hypothetical protein